MWFKVIRTTVRLNRIIKLQHINLILIIFLVLHKQNRNYLGPNPIDSTTLKHHSALCIIEFTFNSSLSIRKYLNEIPFIFNFDWPEGSWFKYVWLHDANVHVFNQSFIPLNSLLNKFSKMNCIKKVRINTTWTNVLISISY